MYKGSVFLVNAITNFIKSVCNRLPDLEKIFPTEASRYNAFIKLLYIGLFAYIIGKILKGLSKPTIHIIGYRQVVEEPSMLSALFMLLCSILVLVVVIIAIYTSIYIFVKSGSLDFAVRLFIGFISGLIVMGILNAILGPIASLISVIVSIIANKKRITMLKQYTSFVWYSIGSVIVPLLCLLVGGIITLFGTYIHSSIAFIGMTLLLISLLAPVLITHYALKKEMSKGRTFLEIMRLMQIIPLVILCCFISFLTLTHFSGLSGDSIFGDPGSDFLANGPIHDFSGASTAYAASPDTSFSFTDSAVNNSMDMHDMSGDTNQSFSHSTADNFAHVTQSQDFVDNQPVNNDNVLDNSDINLSESHTNTTVQNNIGHTVMTAKTNDITGNTTFQDELGHNVGSASTNSVTGDTTLHDNMGQTTGSLTHDGAILNQLNLSDGHIVTLKNGNIAIMDSQHHLIETITADGTIKDPLEQTIGHIKI